MANFYLVPQGTVYVNYDNDVFPFLFNSSRAHFNINLHKHITVLNSL